MTKQIIEQSFNIAPIVGLLVCAVFALGLGIIFLYKKGDKDKKEYNEKIEKKNDENLSITNKMVSELKEDLKDLREENKEDKKTLRLALETFDRTTKEFQMINSNLNEMKTDITVIKEKLK